MWRGLGKASRQQGRSWGASASAAAAALADGGRRVGTAQQCCWRGLSSSSSSGAAAPVLYMRCVGAGGRSRSRSSSSVMMMAMRWRSFASLPTHEVVGLPALSPTMELGTIASWKVKEGSAFAAGDVICQVETDKATVDFESQDDGVLARILVAEGTADVKVGQPIMVIVDDPDSVAAFANYTVDGDVAAAPSPSPPPPTAAAPSPVAVAVSEAPAAAAAKTSAGGRVFASPLARSLATGMGIDISTVRGTGPGGRVIAADVREFEPSKALAVEAEAAAAPAAAAEAAAAPPVPGIGYTDFPTTEAGRALAAQMVVSKQTIPHYYLTVDLNLDKLLAVRASLNESLPEDAQLSLHDLLLKAAALACKQVPDVNASWMDTYVRRYDQVDMNVIVGSGDRLAAPLVRDAGRRGIKAIADDLSAAAGAVQAGEQLAAAHTGVGTFTMVNLGAYGIRTFSPIVQAPQACMLAVGTAEERVLPNEDPESEEIYQISQCLTATLSCDHRVVDGAVGAQWLAAFRGLVENPMTMLL